jgi:hypothetical protein
VSRVRSVGGVTVFEKAETHEFSKPQDAYRQMVRIPLATFSPGDYVLSVEARSQSDGNRAAARHVPFTVEAAGSAR